MKITHSEFVKILQRDYGDSFIRILSNKTFNQFIKEIDKISDSAEDYGYTNLEIEEETKLGKYKFIGDLFEIFAEAFFIQFKSDNRIGVFDYKPVPSEDDNGVDGFGKNIEGEPCTIQVKYRGNPKYLLKERDIKQFAYQSIVNYDVDFKKSNNMIVFTNCEGLHWYTNSKVFNEKIRVINGEMISKLIDNNEGFWNTFKDLMINSVKEVGVVKLTELFIQKLKNEK
jgi:hypothetical protein